MRLAEKPSIVPGAFRLQSWAQVLFVFACCVAVAALWLGYQSRRAPLELAFSGVMFSSAMLTAVAEWGEEPSVDHELHMPEPRLELDPEAGFVLAVRHRFRIHHAASGTTRVSSSTPNSCSSSA